MDLNALKKINSNPDSLEEVQMKNEAPVISEQISFSTSEMNDKIKFIVSEQISLTELIRRKMEQDEKTKQDLEAKLLKSETDRKEQLVKVNTIVKGLLEEIKDLKAMNFKKLEATSEIVSEEARRNQENNIRMIREVVDLAHQIKTIPNPNWKERAKQYGTQLLITIGLATVILGVFRLVILLTTLLKH